MGMRLAVTFAVLSRASTTGWSQLRHQELRVGSYLCTRPTPDAKLAARGYRIDSVLRWGQPGSGESCIVLQSGPTRSLIAKFSQRSVITCSTRISCSRGKTLQTRPQMGVCIPLMPDVVVPKAHQNNHNYMRSILYWYFWIYYTRFSMVGGYTEDLEKP